MNEHLLNNINPEDHKPNKGILFLNNFIRKSGPFWSLIILFVFLSAISRDFLTASNVLNILRQSVITFILAMGVSFVIISGGIDLSVGSVMAFCAAVAAIVFRASKSLTLSILALVGVGILIGLTQGLIVTKGRVPAFVVTLGGLSIYRGLTLIITKGIPISSFPDNVRYLATGYLFKIPAPVIFAALLFIIFMIILYKTRFGRYIYAMGSNEQATRATGINVDLNRTIAFVISGFCAAIAGFIMMGRINSAHPQAGQGYELLAIAAAVIGGISINGGEGLFYGTIIGALIMSLIQNGLNLLEVNPFWQDVVVGLIIIVAVLIDRMRTRSVKI
ncbi:MAG: ABC transporter permease [Candidatus Humimicrobiaceae bacterium]